MTERQKVCIQDYISLLDEFLAGKIQPDVFETRFLRKFKSEQIELPSEAFRVLDQLFAVLDEYCADPALRGPGGMGDEELLTYVQNSRARLTNMKMTQP